MRRARAIRRNADLAAMAVAVAWVCNRIPVFGDDVRAVSPQEILRTLPGYDDAAR